MVACAPFISDQAPLVRENNGKEEEKRGCSTAAFFAGHPMGNIGDFHLITAADLSAFIRLSLEKLVCGHGGWRTD